MDTLNGAEQLFLEAVLVRLVEDHASQWRATAGIVDDLLHQALDISCFLDVIGGPELCGSLAEFSLCREEQGLRLTLTAPADNTAHRCLPCGSCVTCPFFNL